MENYERMIIATLKNIAREKGLRGYSRLKKSELIKNSENLYHLETLLEPSY